jgi:hypothetical protein
MVTDKIKRLNSTMVQKGGWLGTDFSWAEKVAKHNLFCSFLFSD